jgi:glycosyltransferase involved in cell wall biosynthesis
VLNHKKFAVVIPCFNESNNISNVIETIPAFVDVVIVIDDASTDDTTIEVSKHVINNPRIKLITSRVNSGVGAAISKGYLLARDLQVDVVAVMAGDGQMDPTLLSRVAWPVVTDQVDFSKTNRLFDVASIIDIPRHRYIGNFILSFLTKIASGYWKISDAQSGYTVINKKALQEIAWEKMYPRYGQPNDLLISLNTLDFKVADIYTPPRYGVGEQSKMKIRKVIFSIPKILWLGFWRRLWIKYVVRNSHPLVILYLSAFFGGIISFILFIRLLIGFILTNDILLVSAVLFSFSTLFSLQCLSFAMWLDLQSNEERQLTYRLDDIIVED